MHVVASSRFLASFLFVHSSFVLIDGASSMQIICTIFKDFVFLP